MTKFENGETVNEGLCLKCAKELGIKPVDDILGKMGISDEDLDRMDDEMAGIMENVTEDMPAMASDTDNANAPAIDFAKLFGGKEKRKSKKLSGELLP